MLNRSLQIANFALLAALLFLSISAQPLTITGMVVAIADGDTLTVLDDQKRQYKVRLNGIDAPESNQDFGSRAKQSLSDLVFGKTVTAPPKMMESASGASQIRYRLGSSGEIAATL